MSAGRSLWGRLAARDPEGMALRRAGRAAIGVPLSLLIASWLMPGAATTFATFGTLGLLMFADFTGPLRRRALAYLGTVLAAVPLIVVGALASEPAWLAGIVMFAVALGVGLMALLRGAFAASQRTLVLATVIALTASGGTTLPTDLLSWLVGGAVATVLGATLWPSHPRAVLRDAFGRVYRAAAAAVDARWVRPDIGQRALEEALDGMDDALGDLHRVYDGNLARPSGATSADRAFAELLDEAHQLQAFVEWAPREEGVGLRRARELITADRTLALDTAQALSEVSPTLRGAPGDTSPAALEAARDDHVGRAVGWLEQQPDRSDSAWLRRQIAESFPVRLSSVTAQLSVASARRAAGLPEGSSVDGILLQPSRGPWTRLRAHATMSSPWFRNALRSAVALGLAVGVANSVSLQNGFWIVLGTLSALRFDALGTGRTALQALLGTTVGVLIAAGLIAVIGDQPGIWAALLPVVIFAAAYTPGTYSFWVGQAGFSVTVISIFSLVDRATVATAQVRLLDVGIGLAISAVVSAMMWPRGVAAIVRTRAVAGIDAAADHLVAAVDYLAGGVVDDRTLRQYRSQAQRAREMAQETYDLAIAQAPPDMRSITIWVGAVNSIKYLDYAAKLIPRIRLIVGARGGTPTMPLPVLGALLAAANEVRATAMTAVRCVAESQSTGPENGTRPAAMPTRADRATVRAGLAPGVTGAQAAGSLLRVRDLRSALDSELAHPSPWYGTGQDPRAVLLIWIADWMEMLEWNARRIGACSDPAADDRRAVS